MNRNRRAWSIFAAFPLWPCLCGARNRLRDTACRNCGAAKP